jgi:hypothetical protein
LSVWQPSLARISILEACIRVHARACVTCMCVHVTCSWGRSTSCKTRFASTPPKSTDPCHLISSASSSPKCCRALCCRALCCRALCEPRGSHRKGPCRSV